MTRKIRRRLYRLLVMLEKPLLPLICLIVACGAPAPTPVAVTETATPIDTSSPLPINACTPTGVIYCVLNPDVTQATINQTICVSGWTATVRPPVSYTEPIKQQELAAGQNLHSGDTNISDYELDHRMPLELGGSPRDLKNLSLEYPRSTNPKDQDENYFKQQVCSGAMTLAAAQAALVNKWLLPYPSYRQ